jgi:hypothetical protein
VGLYKRIATPAALFYSIEAHVMTAKTKINDSEQVVVIDEKKSNHFFCSTSSSSYSSSSYLSTR